MLGSLISSKARVRLLSFLIENGSQEYHIKELCRRTSLDPQQITRETTFLWKLDLLCFRVEKNRKYFRLNKACPYVKGLIALIREEQAAENQLFEVYRGPPLFLDAVDLLRKINHSFSDIISEISFCSLFARQTTTELKLKVTYSEARDLTKGLIALFLNTARMDRLYFHLRQIEATIVQETWKIEVPYQILSALIVLNLFENPRWAPFSEVTSLQSESRHSPIYLTLKNTLEPLQKYGRRKDKFAVFSHLYRNGELVTNAPSDPVTLLAEGLQDREGIDTNIVPTHS